MKLTATVMIFILVSVLSRLSAESWSTIKLSDPSRVAVALEAFYTIASNNRGQARPVVDYILGHHFDTNGFMLYSEKMRVSNRLTNVESIKFSKYIFLSRYNPVQEENSGAETVDEYDQFGNLTTRSEVGKDSNLVLRNLYTQRFEGAYRYVTDTEYNNERSTGKKVLSVYRDNQLVLDIVDNRDEKGTLYKYYYYSNRRLTAVKASVKSFLKEEVQYNIVYRYDVNKNAFTEDKYEYYPRPRHIRSIYRYDRNGNLVRFEQFTDNRLTGMKTIDYDYR